MLDLSKVPFTVYLAVIVAVVLLVIMVSIFIALFKTKDDGGDVAKHADPETVQEIERVSGASRRYKD